MPRSNESAWQKCHNSHEVVGKNAANIGLIGLIASSAYTVLTDNAFVQNPDMPFEEALAIFGKSKVFLFSIGALGGGTATYLIGLYIHTRCTVKKLLDEIKRK